MTGQEEFIARVNRAQVAARILSRTDDSEMPMVSEMLNPEIFADGLAWLLTPTFNGRTGTRPDAEGARSVAAMLCHFPHDRMHEVLGGLEERWHDGWRSVLASLFTYEALSVMRSVDVQMWLGKLDYRILGRALHDTSSELLEFFVRAMGERAARLLRDEIESLGLVRPFEVEEARAAMMAMLFDLIAEGSVDATFAEAQPGYHATQDASASTLDRLEREARSATPVPAPGTGIEDGVNPVHEAHASISRMLGTGNTVGVLREAPDDVTG